jgi:hypothetical protein
MRVICGIHQMQYNHEAGCPACTRAAVYPPGTRARDYGPHPGGAEDVSRLVKEHSTAMMDTLLLPKNRRKGDWLGDDPFELLKLLEQEVRKLYAVVWQWEHGGSPDRVRSEAADVSNFAAMVADVCQRTAPPKPRDACPE